MFKNRRSSRGVELWKTPWNPLSLCQREQLGPSRVELGGKDSIRSSELDCAFETVDYRGMIPASKGRANFSQLQAQQLAAE